MKAATGNLVTLLATARQFYMEDVLTLELATGNVSYSTNRSNANATDPIFKRGGVRTQIGVEVSQMSVDLFCNKDTLIAGLPAIAFGYSGGLDGANMMCVRYVRATPAGAIQGNLGVFAGSVADLTIDAAGIHMMTVSQMDLLNAQLPRNMYQAGCIHDLYDPACGVVAANFTSTANVAANSTIYAVRSNLAQANGFFGLGVMAFTTGNLAGTTRSVKTSYANGVVVPMLQLPEAPAAGDHFTIKPGCDKLEVTCNLTFNNTANFRGYEFIPTPETSY